MKAPYVRNPHHTLIPPADERHSQRLQVQEPITLTVPFDLEQPKQCLKMSLVTSGAARTLPQETHILASLNSPKTCLLFEYLEALCWHWTVCNSRYCSSCNQEPSPYPIPLHQLTSPADGKSVVSFSVSSEAEIEVLSNYVILWGFWKETGLHTYWQNAFLGCYVGLSSHSTWVLTLAPREPPHSSHEAPPFPKQEMRKCLSC